MAAVVRKHAKPKNMRRTLQFLSRYFKNHFAVLSLVAVLIVIGAGANVFGTYMIKPIVNGYIIPGDIPGLVYALLFLGAVYLAGVAATHAYSQLMVKVAQQIVQELRDDLFRHVQTLPMRFFDSKTHGELMSRFTSDIDTIAEALNNSVATMIQSFVVIVGTFTALLLLSVRLTAIVAVAFLGMYLFIRHSGKKSHKYFADQQKYIGSLNGFIEETVAGQKVVKVFNHEESNLAEFSHRNEKLQKSATGALTYSGLMIPVVVSISYLNYAISACAGAYFAIAGLIDLGTLASYLVFVRQTAMPFNQFSQQANFVLAALAGAERILEMMEEQPETDEGTVTLVNTTQGADGSQKESAAQTGHWAWKKPDGALVPLRGEVRLNDVAFSYEPGTVILKDISLYAKPGQKIAFVGSTGAGKTTIANLLNRFYDVSSGSITYDGIDVREIKKDALRHAIAVVLQDTHLFTGTIAENICYGRPQASMEDVVKAAKLANADSFIRRLPEGYDTMLRGDGTNLSQGQRQLLAIARAAITNPPVLILDEATSSVDTYTERLIEAGMDRLMEGRTVFVIAHRLSTVRNANAIIVLEQGTVLERGSHAELVAKKGRYYQLYTGQFELS